MIKQLRNKKGFTLIEIIVVIVILAVLMAVAVPSVLNYINEGNNAKYMSVARGAMIQTEAQLAKAYAAEEATYDAAYTTAITNTNNGSGTLKVKSIEAWVDSAKLADKADPSTVTKYVVTFTGSSKTATVTVNGKVTIE